MNELYNLVVDLDERFDAARAPAPIAGIELVPSAPASERALAWIDEEFGGAWSSEAHAGTNAIASADGGPIGFATFDAKGMRFRWLRGLASERDVGVFGPFGVAETHRERGVGRALLWYALAGLRERGYARALIAAVGDEELVGYYGAVAGARVAERFDRSVLAEPRPRVLMLASGSGSNVGAVLDGWRDGTLPIDIAGVISNKKDAGVLQRASRANVGAEVYAWNKREKTRDVYDDVLIEAVVERRPDLVLLLGWMHLLPERFVRAFPNVLNVHPAFLPLDPERDDVAVPDGTHIPAYRGAHAVRDALAASSPWIGATVHWVTPATDRGPVMVRKPLRVLPDENEDAVMARLHPLEHRLVASAVRRWMYER